MNRNFSSKILMLFLIGFLMPLGLISRSLAEEDWCSDPQQIRKLLDKSLEEGQNSPSFSKVVKCQQKAVFALSEIVEESQKRIEANQKQIEQLQGKVLITSSAISALKKIGPEAEEAVPTLIKALEYPINKEIRTASEDALTAIVPASIPQLIEVLKNKPHREVEVRSRTGKILGRILGNNWDLDRDLEADAIESLISILKKGEKENQDVRWAVAWALGRAAESERIPSARGQDILIPLVNMLEDSRLRPQARGAAAQALGKIGLDAKTVLPRLINQFKMIKENNSFCPRISEALALYAEIIAKNSSNLQGLKTISDIKRALKQSSCVVPKKHQQRIDLAEKALKGQFISEIVQQIKELFWLLFGLLICIVYLVGNLAIFWLRPLWLLNINDALKVTELTIPSLELKISFSALVLFKYHPRVLNAWIKSHLNIAVHKFEAKETVSERNIHVSVPVYLRFSQIDANFQNINALSIEHLRRIFSERKVCLLIWGTGGSGKTSLACQIARWLMKRQALSASNTPVMIPVLIEQELTQSQDSSPLLAAIAGQLQYLIDAPQPISQDLLEQLLRQQRILVIVDRLSEMDSDTREMIAPHLPDFPINALIVTSRIKEYLGNVIDAEIKIPKINGKYLANFIYDYLEQRKQLDLFSHQELFNACAQLSIIALSREEITIFLAKLYAEQLINSKLIGLAIKADRSTPSPNNIPELIVNYLEKLNQKVERQDNQEYPEFKESAKVIAWKCLEQSYKPQPVMRRIIIEALGKDRAEVYLNYLEQRLHLIRSIGLNQDKIKFVIDPIAEYLAGLYLVEKHCNTNPERWRIFLDRAKSKPPKEIVGFLSALRECYLLKKTTVSLPNFVLDELSTLLDPIYTPKKQKPTSETSVQRIRLKE